MYLYTRWAMNTWYMFCHVMFFEIFTKCNANFFAWIFLRGKYFLELSIIENIWYKLALFRKYALQAAKLGTWSIIIYGKKFQFEGQSVYWSFKSWKTLLLLLSHDFRQHVCHIQRQKITCQCKCKSPMRPSLRPPKEAWWNQFYVTPWILRNTSLPLATYNCYFLESFVFETSSTLPDSWSWLQNHKF